MFKKIAFFATPLVLALALAIGAPSRAAAAPSGWTMMCDYQQYGVKGFKNGLVDVEFYCWYENSQYPGDMSGAGYYNFYLSITEFAFYLGNGEGPAPVDD